ncbi:uncharacterized protein LOC110020810 [Phalaenopsis equestris]|uniref:uncharacterized protein LOC110020810 n=1 Tax=Phalaenopsis equestris TaxID=78828 RepID=UPI0009E3AD72|nr:uncharacterized protein LOC110020810 [Phalaenopsis equestris]
MAKKSQKRSPRLRKENSSCMGGLISMFDFRQGRSGRRLLSDKKCGSVRNLGIGYSSSQDDLSCNIGENHGDAENLAYLSDAEADEADMFNLGVASIKELMEEEMSRTHRSRKDSSSKIEWLEVELELETNAERSRNEQDENFLVGSDDQSKDLDVSTKLIFQQSDYPNISEVLTSDMDVAAFMVDCCSTSFQFEDKTDQRTSHVSIEDLKKTELEDESVTILQKAIVNIAKVIIKQKSISSSKVVGNTDVQQAEEFSHLLEMLNSDKDLFLKLIENPNSPIQKQIEELQNVQIGKTSNDENQFLGEFQALNQTQKKGGHHFFMRREKLTEGNQSNDCSGAKIVNRIVVLKPNLVRKQNHSNTVHSVPSIQSNCSLENKEDGERISSHFSLREIKRRFRNAVSTSKKERLSITMDGILHKIPYGKQISSKNKISCSTEAIESEDENKSNTNEMQRKNELSYPTNTVSGHKILNKNAAPQKLYREAAFYDEARKHLSELLRMDIKAESLSAIQASKSLGKILSFPGFNYFSPRLSPAIGKELKSPQEKTSIFLCHYKHNFGAKYLGPSRQKESFPNSSKSLEAENGSMEITEIEDYIQTEEVEAHFASISNEDDLHGKIFMEEGSSAPLEPVKIEDVFQPSTPTASTSVVLQEPRDAECTIDNPGRPSPISVLEPLYFEDLSSPASFITEHGTNAEGKIQPKESQTDTSVAASDSIDSWFDEASLFDELELSYGSLINDPKFLFDLIDEVVTEIKERNFSGTPWATIIKPSIRRIQKQEDFINESYRRINWHLDVQFPTKMEQAVKKDFDGGVWFNLQLEAEDAVNEIENEILDYLFEETALELWD